MSQMMKSRLETAVVRPFSGLGPIDSSLESVVFVVGSTKYSAGAVVLPNNILAEEKLSVVLPSKETLLSSLSERGLNPDDCSLVVLGTGRSHRISEVVFNEPVDYTTDSDLTSFSIYREDHDLVFNDTSGFTVTLAVVLTKHLEEEALKPSAAGTWIARRVFDVKPELDDSSFTPEPLTPEIIKAYALPSKTMRFVQAEGLLSADSLSDAVRVYVDASVLSMLLANPTAPACLQFQIELAMLSLEIVARSIAAEIAEECGEVNEEIIVSYPLCASFYLSLAKRLNVPVGELILLANDSSDRLRPYLENCFDMTGSSVAMLKEI